VDANDVGDLIAGKQHEVHFPEAGEFRARFEHQTVVVIGARVGTDLSDVHMMAAEGRAQGRVGPAWAVNESANTTQGLGPKF
jgi:hypothetical protein